MESATIKKGVVFFAGILGAVLLADALSTILVSAAGLEGSMKFFASFILYAALFFAILYGIQKIFHFEFFGFWRE
jgi:heme A synthase